MFRFTFFLVVLFLFEWYVFRALRKQFSFGPKWLKILAAAIYWIIPVFYITAPFLFHPNGHKHDIEDNVNQLYLGASIALIYIPKFIIMVFKATQDVTKPVAWISKKLSPINSKTYKIADGISRSEFISRIGIIISAIPFASLLYSIVIGRFNFQLNKRTIYFDHLPKAFDGFKIVQFSDLHAGSLIGQENKFKKALEMVNNQNADIIVFTGDMVNNSADELNDWIEPLSALKAPIGKFSIFGNHDYGNYMRWNNDEEKAANLEKLKHYQAKSGFNLLLNDSVIIEKNNEKIALLGVENWGEKHLPRMGRLDLAMEKVKDIPFKILLSHDPTHWDNQVTGKTDIALTLSGHTHGLQMAINIGNYSWSPISYRYKRWHGLYTEQEQYLYVNKGLGYIDFPGRIGADPEITVFELKAKS